MVADLAFIRENSGWFTTTDHPAASPHLDLGWIRTGRFVALQVKSFIVDEIQPDQALRCGREESSTL